MKKIQKWETWGNDIAPIEVDRESAKSVWIDGAKHRKNDSWRAFFDSREEAVSFILRRAESQLAKSEERFEYAKRNKRDAEKRLKMLCQKFGSVASR